MNEALQKPVLLYGAECWRMMDGDINKINVFHTKNLKRILKLFWPQTLANEVLLERCESDNLATTVKKRRWTWVDHVLRREPNSLLWIAFH